MLPAAFDPEARKVWVPNDACPRCSTPYEHLEADVHDIGGQLFDGEPGPWGFLPYRRTRETSMPRLIKPEIDGYNDVELSLDMSFDPFDATWRSTKSMRHTGRTSCCFTLSTITIGCRPTCKPKPKDPSTHGNWMALINNMLQFYPLSVPRANSLPPAKGWRAFVAERRYLTELERYDESLGSQSDW
jgi:hypothetical protein